MKISQLFISNYQTYSQISQFEKLLQLSVSAFFLLSLRYLNKIKVLTFKTFKIQVVDTLRTFFALL